MILLFKDEYNRCSLYTLYSSSIYKLLTANMEIKREHYVFFLLPLSSTISTTITTSSTT